jgi:hypothetical protein
MLGKRVVCGGGGRGGGCDVRINIYERIGEAKVPAPIGKLYSQTKPYHL